MKKEKVVKWLKDNEEAIVGWTTIGVAAIGCLALGYKLGSVSNVGKKVPDIDVDLPDWIPTDEPVRKFVSSVNRYYKPDQLCRFTLYTDTSDGGIKVSDLGIVGQFAINQGALPTETFTHILAIGNAEE